MEISDFRISKDGLKKLLDFLHSDENISRLGTENIATSCFVLSETNPVVDGYYGNPRYNVHIVAQVYPKNEQVKGLLDLLKEIYQ